MLPTFIICGAPKAGTSSLYFYLKQHPEIFMPVCKEPLFFSNNFDKGLSWYENIFSNYSGEKEIGEASTWYMRDENCAARISATIPQVKLLFVLRNPIDRAYSDFWYNIQTGYLKPGKSFSEFIRSIDKKHWLINTGFYFEQITRYRQYFQRNNMFFMTSEELHKKNKDLLVDIFDFLQVDNSFSPESKGNKNVTMIPKNISLYTWFSSNFPGLDKYIIETPILRPIRTKIFFSKNKKYPSISEEDRSFLFKIYRTDIANLSEFLEKDLSHWK